MIEITFDQKGTFKALGACEDWCRENDVSFGSLSSPYPTGLMWGDIRIAKWKNLETGEIKRLHGRFFSKDYREGPVLLSIVERGGGVHPYNPETDRV